MAEPAWTAVPSAAPPVRIAPPDSVEEREADRIADGVIRGGRATPSAASTLSGVIHRQCATCVAGGPACADCAEDEPLMLSRKGPAPTAAAPQAASVVIGGGSPLAPALRRYFEPRMSADLSTVRLHTGPAAAAAARGVNARAFTLGSHIAFARGEYAPESRDGRHLIAHELAHVVARGGTTIRRDVYDDATRRALTPPDLQPLSMDELDELLAYLRGLYSPNSSSSDDDGIAMNIAAVEAAISQRSQMSFAPEPVEAEQQTQATAPGPEAEPLDPEMPELATGGYAAYSGYSLEHVDSMTNWDSEESRREYQQSYLDWAQRNDEQLYSDALEYLFELSQRKASEAREAALEQEAEDLSGGDVSAIVAETGLDREFVEAFLASYNVVPRHPGVIDPRGVPFIQLSAPRFVMASLVKDFIPGIGLYEGITGRDVLTNRELETWERFLGAGLDLLPFATRALSGPTRAAVRGTARVAARAGRSLAELGRHMGRSLRGRIPARSMLRIIGRLGQTSPEAIRVFLRRIRQVRRAGGSMRLTRQDRELLEEIFGAGGRSRGGRRATMHQRQRAAALREEAEVLDRQAARFDDNAARIEASRPEGARRARQRAEGLRADAASRRAEAEEFSSGRRSATEDLPGPEDVDLAFDTLQAEQPMVRIGLNAAERAGQDLPRIARSLSRSRSGNRVVFRVEGGGSRSRVIVDADGNVTLRRGATIHFNFGSLERAQEFLRKRAAGSRIVAFEVEEGWVRSARSAAIPEGGTAAVGGRQPRLVDVTYADDQMEIPPGLLADMEEFIVPGSGRIVEVAR